MAKNISFNIRDCQGYSSLASGTHSLQIRTKYSTLTSPISSSVNFVVEGAPAHYLTFQSLRSFSLSISGTKEWDGAMLYSTNGTTWNTWNGESITATRTGQNLYSLYLCGVGNTKVSAIGGHFSLSGQPFISISGNIESLLDYRYVDTGTPITNNVADTYAYLFKDNANITSVSSIQLPRTTLNVNGIYKGMFMGCSRITSAPTLPATTLTESCYESMFTNCSHLLTAPTLPATTMQPSCYKNMFAGCTALTATPTLASTSLATSCYESMFDSCTSLTTLTSLPATTLPTSCYQEMFVDCSAITSIPTISATSVGYASCDSMFYGCYHITSVPTLAFTTVGDYGCQSMFAECSAITTVGNLNASSVQICGYRYMFMGCVDLTTVGSINATLVDDESFASMFEGCTSLTSNPTLKFTPTHEKVCYRMFYGCTDLINASQFYSTSQLAYGISSCESMYEGCGSLIIPMAIRGSSFGEGACRNMYKNCLSLEDYGTFTMNANVSLGVSCFEGMFERCLHLTKLPPLNALTLPTDCYKRMFANCSRIKISTIQGGIYRVSYRIPNDPNTTATTSGTPTTDMFVGTGGTFVGTPNINQAYYMFEIPTSYLEFYAESGNVSVNGGSLVFNGTILYSTNEKDWFDWNKSTITSSRVYLAGVGNNLVRGDYHNEIGFILSGVDIHCKGDVDALLDYYNFEYNISISRNPMAFGYLFADCGLLVEPPTLSSTTLVYQCYQGMFKNCNQLLYPPELPATTLQSRCYEEMFEGCSNLLAPPYLPFTNAPNYCCRNMFKNCSNIVIPTFIYAETWGDYCFAEMFNATNIDMTQRNSAEYPYLYHYRLPSSGVVQSRGTGSIQDMFANTPTGEIYASDDYYAKHRPIPYAKPYMYERLLFSASNFEFKIMNLTGTFKNIVVFTSSGEVIFDQIPASSLFVIDQTMSTSLNDKVQDYLDGQLEEDVIVQFYDGGTYSQSLILLEANA